MLITARAASRMLWSRTGDQASPLDELPPTPGGLQPQLEPVVGGVAERHQVGETTGYPHGGHEREPALDPEVGLDVQPGGEPEVCHDAQRRDRGEPVGAARSTTWTRWA
jgi:hypothetical protein